MVKQNDVVVVDGVESTVETSWGQGRHRVFKLADGRQIFDLDKLVASGKATVQAPSPEVTKKTGPGPVPEKKTWLP